MTEAMDAVGLPIYGEERRIICIGHSVGGQLCRHYAKNLPSIKTIVQLDSVPTNTFFIYIEEGKGVDPRTAYETVV